MLKQFLLAVLLIAAPVAVFYSAYHYLAPVAEVQGSLGDLSGLRSIASDVQAITATGDLAKAQLRITDFETEWDKQEATMRPLNGAAWGNIDDAADEAIHALRAGTPKAADVTKAVNALIATIDSPYDTGDAGGVNLVSGIAVTDESGHPLACETLIKPLRAAIDGGKIPSTKSADAANFLSHALERCNADDDAHANEFSAQGLALATKG
ncbi:hypothetical protein [Aestuariivirga sp.]|uniref:hypothetical protein n=1 Tax=Aestuariivirga sp. TaxID=2650926 RepID=UPI003018373D